jgi:hypothetical protein
MSRVVLKVLKAGSRFKAMDYNGRKETQGKARLMHFANFGLLQDGRSHVSSRDMRRYLELYSAMNSRIRHPQFHAILSAKGQTVSPEELTRLALSVMEGLGYRDNPVAVYAHSDTRNTHVHVVSSRVGPDGRKIADRFEGMRAQRLLHAAMEIDTSKEFQRDLSAALSYRFSSIRQFELLMELRGYRSRRDGDSIRFFRHGKSQGSVTLSRLQRQMAAHPIGASQAARLRGLILANANGLDRTLVEKNSGRGKGKNSLGSAFTDDLHRRFGLQFVFFSSSGHQRPYGYAIIDHANKAVYKGGGVLRLAQVIGESDLTSRGKSSVGGCNEGDDAYKRTTALNDGGSLASSLDDLIRQVEGDVLNHLKIEEGASRKRKRKPSRNG